jgi:transposase
VGRTHPRSLVQPAIRSRLEPIKRAGANHQAALRRHSQMDRYQIANGLIEGINSLVQAAKTKARGYRSLRNLIAITYMIAGKIDLKLAT